MDFKSFGKSLVNAGLDAVTGGFGSAITSGLGSLFGGLFGSSGPSQEDLMKWQEKMMQKQFDFQSQQAELNRKFQSQQSLDARNFSAEQAEISRNWNSIGSQLKRADASGVNPFALVGSGNYGSATGATPASAVGIPSGSMPSVASVPQPAPNTRLQEAQAFSATAAALSSLADAKERGVNTEFAERSMNDRLRQLKNDADGQDLVNAYQRILNKYADRRQSAEINQIWSNIDLMTSQEMLNHSTTDKVNKEISYLAEKIGLTALERRQLSEYLDKYFDRRQEAELAKINSESQLNLQKAATEQNVRANLDAQSEMYRSQSQYTDALKEFQGYVNTVKKAVNDKEKVAELAKFDEAAKQYPIYTQQLQTALEIAIKNKDWTTAINIMNVVTGYLNSTANVLGAVASAVPGSGGYTGVETSVSTYEDNAGNRSSTKTTKTRSRK